MFCGNGDSASDARHLSAEFLVKLKPMINRNSIPALSLTLDSKTLTACGNDYGFKNIFSRVLEGFGNKKDILIVISTSGNSLSPGWENSAMYPIVFITKIYYRILFWAH